MEHNYTVLGFDIGLTRTGVASGQSLTMSATPCTTIDVKNGRHDWVKLDDIIVGWEPQKIIIGDPQTSDANLNKAINRFKSHIQQNHKLPIICVDERLTSAAANQEFSKRDVSKKRKIMLRDQLAACLILEDYFNSL